MNPKGKNRKKNKKNRQKAKDININNNIENINSLNDKELDDLLGISTDDNLTQTTEATLLRSQNNDSKKQDSKNASKGDVKNASKNESNLKQDSQNDFKPDSTPKKTKNLKIQNKNNSPNQKKLFSPPLSPIKVTMNPNKFDLYGDHPCNSPKFTESNSSEEEGLEEYEINGYHPAHVGEVLLNRYIVMQKLGWGHFSTAWLGYDTKYSKYVAIKIQKSKQNYIDAAYDEVEILQELAKHDMDKEWVESVKKYWEDEPDRIKGGVTSHHTQIVQFLNSFIHHGQNGRHFCMVFEIMGVTLLDLIKRYNYKGIPLPYVRIITKQLLIGLDFLHRICGIIHTDMKPENVLVCLTDQELEFILKNGQYQVSRATGKDDKKRKHKDAKENKEKEKENKDKEKDKDKELKDKEKERKESLKENLKDHNDHAINSINNNKEDLNENPNDITDSSVATNEQTNAKKIERKMQKYKKKQIKKLEKQGINKSEIEKQVNELMEKKKLELENENLDTNLYNFKLDEYLDRPYVQSVPKKYKHFQLDDNSDYLDEYDDEFNIEDYSDNLQYYIKERRKILKNEDYRHDLILRNNLLKNAKTEKEKSSAYKKMEQIMDDKNMRGPPLDPKINVKICDMGNACWFSNHFSTTIQTRQYRAPEVLLEKYYNEKTDLWSLACIVFELITGNFLFAPRVGQTYAKDDDHLACFIRVLGKMPKRYALTGNRSNYFFTKDGYMRRIKHFDVITIKELLMLKYGIIEKEAQAIEEFLLPMLEYDINKRASAQEMLNHPWLKMEPNFDYRMSQMEVERLKNFYKLQTHTSFDRPVETEEEDNIEADDEDNSADEDEASFKGKFYKEDDSFYGSEKEEDKIKINNFNNSFAAYGQFIDLAALDRPNPQFDELHETYE